MVYVFDRIFKDSFAIFTQMLNFNLINVVGEKKKSKFEKKGKGFSLLKIREASKCACLSDFP